MDLSHNGNTGDSDWWNIIKYVAISCELGYLGNYGLR